MSNKVLNLDISKDPKFNPIIYGRVGDGENQRVTIVATGRDEQIDLTGWTITFEGETSGGKTKVFDSDNIVSTSEGLKKGTFDYIFPNMAFAVAGKYKRAYFSFIKGNVRDTTGDIKIIVLGNADIDAPEAETIITEYNKLVEELRKLQDQSISEMNQNFAATEAKITALEKQLSDTQSELQQALKDFENGNFWKKEESFNKEESSANVIYQIIGKNDVELTLNLDFKNKVAGSNVENANSGSFSANTQLLKPSQFTVDRYMDYPKYYALDGNVQKINNSEGTNRAQVLVKFNAIDAISRSLGEKFWTSQGADTLAKKIMVAKKLMTYTNYHVHGFGSSPSGNKLSTAYWLEDLDNYSITRPSNNTNQTKEIVYTFFDTNAKKTISPDGNCYILVYADATDGTTGSTINLDYVRFELKLKMSIPDFINSMMAAYSGENVDKKFVGLGNVDNYATATQVEAEAGTSTNKFMTPQGSRQFYLKETRTRRQKWDEGLNWIAHRGNNTEYPENSLPAFQQATRHWGIETDIQVTSDGKWVVMHDATVDRTTNGSGAVSSMTLNQFRALRIDTGPNIATLSDSEKIPPTLEEYLIICKQFNKVPVIEIKSGSYSAANYTLLKDTLNLFGYDESNCVIASFDFIVLTNIRAIYPNMELHMFFNSIDTNTINQLMTLGIPAVASCSYSNASVTAANVKLLHAAGLKVGVWTVNDDKFEEMKKLGVDYITTNSLSGNLRYSKLTYQNGFVDGGGIADATYVEELGGSAVHANFNVERGINTQNSPIALFPEWAVPVKRQYSQCSVRTSTGVVLGSFDINARTNPNGVTAGSIAVGLNWSDRTTWAAGSTVYKI
ncbi:glycerophosphodiester phosphodiesterase family protein [Enterococcus devriesei]|uniref:glycerophosphodiester phosphodiesterase family protein n=1 Tax=Enterococcus devriesei TaxID=319970 RepID=UPI0036D43B0E